MGLLGSIAGKKKKKKADKKKPAVRKENPVEDESTFDGVVRDLEKELKKDSIVVSRKRPQKK